VSYIYIYIDTHTHTKMEYLTPPKGGNRPDRPTEAYGLAYLKPSSVQLV